MATAGGTIIGAMDDFFTPGWFLSSFVAGVVINWVAAYSKPTADYTVGKTQNWLIKPVANGLKKLLGRMSTRMAERMERSRLQRRERVKELVLEDGEELLEATEATRFQLRGVASSVNAAVFLGGAVLMRSRWRESQANKEYWIFVVFATAAMVALFATVKENGKANSLWRNIQLARRLRDRVVRDLVKKVTEEKEVAKEEEIFKLMDQDTNR